MEWKTLAARTSAVQLEALEALFWRTGALSVTVADAGDNPIFEPGPGELPLWDKVTATGLYEDGVNVEEIRAEMAAAGFELLYVESLGDRVWEREWLERFRPMPFGKRLWVRPSGFEVNEPGAVIMELDPGLAFGTGTHATTRMCLEWLDANIKPGMSVLDFGSGSGILGIGALLLGAVSVTAVDNDPQALVATRENARRNGVEDKLQACLPGELGNDRFNVVMANILAGPLIDLSETLLGLMQPGGNLILSGIMASQSEWVKKAYPLMFVSETSSESWVLLYARKS